MDVVDTYLLAQFKKDPYQMTLFDEPEKVQYSDGMILYWYKGNLHRDDGPAAIYSDGTEEWYQHGELHREDGPAIVKSDGTEQWYQNGRLHRTDGPAIITHDGIEAWWENGEFIKSTIQKQAQTIELKQGEREEFAMLLKVS